MSYDDDNEDRRRGLALLRQRLLTDLEEPNLPRGGDLCTNRGDCFPCHHAAGWQRALLQ
jgi:hypothetical protein